MELTLTSAKDNSSYIQCGHDVEEDTTCTLKGVIPHVPDTDPKSLNIAVNKMNSGKSLTLGIII